MQFYKYWTKKRSTVTTTIGQIDVTSLGFSNESLEDALRIAEQRATQAGERISSNKNLDRYYATNHAVREETIEELQRNGQTTAILSRNSYGSVILNTPIVFFADIDLPQRSKVSSLLKWFSKPVDPTEQLLARIQEMIGVHPSLGLRLYRTKKGFRIAIRSQQVPVESVQSQKWLEHLGSDHLYVLLCKSQDCYRARLSPKPWRCQVPPPPTRFPFSTPQEESTYREWQVAYEQASRSFATCALVGDFGSPDTDPVVDQILQLHDHFAFNGTQPLA